MSDLEPCATYNTTTGKWIETDFGRAQNARVNAILANNPAAMKMVLDRLAVILGEEERS